MSEMVKSNLEAGINFVHRGNVTHVLLSYRFDVLNIDDIAEFTRSDNLSYLMRIRRIAENCPKNLIVAVKLSVMFTYHGRLQILCRSVSRLPPSQYIPRASLPSVSHTVYDILAWREQ